MQYESMNEVICIDINRYSNYVPVGRQVVHFVVASCNHAKSEDIGRSFVSMYE